MRKIGRSFRIDNICDGRVVSFRFEIISDRIGSSSSSSSYYSSDPDSSASFNLFVCLFVLSRRKEVSTHYEHHESDQQLQPIEENGTQWVSRGVHSDAARGAAELRLRDGRSGGTGAGGELFLAVKS